MNYKNIVFDLGNVLIDFNPEKYLMSKIQEADSVSDLHKLIYLGEEWQMLDRGTLTEEEAINVLIQKSSQHRHLIELAFDNWYEMLTPIQDTVEIVRQLKEAGFQIYYLSNFQMLAFENIREKYDFFELFNGGIVSYKEKQLKPEEGIYRRLMEEYDIKPEESIFIDDLKANIEGARRLNFETILFQGPRNLKDELAKLGII